MLGNEAVGKTRCLGKECKLREMQKNPGLICAPGGCMLGVNERIMVYRAKNVLLV